MRDSFHSSCFDFRFTSQVQDYGLKLKFSTLFDESMYLVRNDRERRTSMHSIELNSLVWNHNVEGLDFGSFHDEYADRRLQPFCASYSIISQCFWSFSVMLINRNATKRLHIHANVRWSLRARKNARFVLWLNTHHARVTFVHIKPPVYELFYFLFLFLFDLQR